MVALTQENKKQEAWAFQGRAILTNAIRLVARRNHVSPLRRCAQRVPRLQALTNHRASL